MRSVLVVEVGENEGRGSIESDVRRTGGSEVVGEEVEMIGGKVRANYGRGTSEKDW